MFNENFLLKSPLACQLYDAVKDLPVIDFHNHLPVNDLASDRQYSDIAELWVISDPYKHRAMRICGVPEKLITGDADHRQKFNAWAETLPKLMGNPLYHWSMLELKRIFNIEEALDPLTADSIWEKCNAMLQGKEFSACSLLKRFNVVYSAPCAALNDDVSVFANISGNVPSLRGDDILLPNAEFTARLAAASGVSVNDMTSFIEAVKVRLDAFDSAGCHIADHSLDNGFAYRSCSDEAADALFTKCQQDAAVLSAEEKMTLASVILKKLCSEYSRRNWMLLLHIGAQRATSSRLRAAAGPAGGFAAIGHTCDTAALAAMLNDIEQTASGLPRTVLFTLNPADHAAFSVLSGSFPGDGVRGKVQLGPAWWYCDHIYGMRDGFENAAAFGVLSQFIGMTTDSRSILSFVRHEYFRRVLCAWLAEKADKDEMPSDPEILISLVRAIAFENASIYLGGI